MKGALTHFSIFDRKVVVATGESPVPQAPINWVINFSKVEKNQNQDMQKLGF
jgi:hypothetical protein